MKDKLLRKVGLKVLAAIGITLLSIEFLHNLGDTWDRAAYDFLFEMRGEVHPPLDIVVVAIDDASFSELNLQWPWPRELHAKLLDSLFDAGVKSVAIDLLFETPTTPEADQALASAIDRHKNVVLATEISHGEYDTVQGGYEVNASIIDPRAILERTKNHHETGFTNLEQDPDGYIRRVTPKQWGLQGFALVATRKFAEQKNESFSPNIANSAEGNSYWINFAGPPRTIKTISYYQALDPKTYLPKNYLKNKLVFVGFSLSSEAETEGLPDHFLVPFSSAEVGFGDMPGVEIHANIADNILRNRFITPAAPMIMDRASMLLGTVAGVLFLFIRPFFGTVVYALLLAFCTGISFKFFAVDLYYLSPVYLLFPTTICYIVSPFAHYWQTHRQKTFIRKAFSTYLPPRLVTELLKNPDRLKLGGEQAEGTIVFIDLAGFTSFSETLQPEELIDLVNRVLGKFAEIILHWDGMIDKYIGDAIMAVWGIPIAQEDHAVKACSAALEIQRSIDAIIEEEKQITGVSFSVRVGVNSGTVVAGNVGGGQQFNYTVLGNEVNLASRLEGINKFYGTDVVISEATAILIDGNFPLRELDIIRVKGQQKPVKVFELCEPTNGEKTRKSDVDEIFQAGRKLYHLRKWIEASACFKQGLELDPNDGPCENFMQRCEEYQTYPPSSDWDGVYEMLSK